MKKPRIGRPLKFNKETFVVSVRLTKDHVKILKALSGTTPGEGIIKMIESLRTGK